MIKEFLSSITHLDLNMYPFQVRYSLETVLYRMREYERENFSDPSSIMLKISTLMECLEEYGLFYLFLKKRAIESKSLSRVAEVGEFPNPSSSSHTNAVGVIENHDSGCHSSEAATTSTNTLTPRNAPLSTTIAAEPSHSTPEKDLSEIPDKSLEVITTPRKGTSSSTAAAVAVASSSNTLYVKNCQTPKRKWNEACDLSILSFLSHEIIFLIAFFEQSQQL